MSSDIEAVDQSVDNAVRQQSEVPTGVALEKARRRVGFGAEDAAASLGISPGMLADYEAGLRTPNEELIDAMSTLYGVEPGRFASRPWVPRVPPRYDAEAGILWMGWNSIKVVEKDNEHLARSLADALRSMRSLAETSPVLVRTADLSLLARLFDLYDPELTDHLERYLRISPTDALKIVNEMVVIASVSG